MSASGSGDRNVSPRINFLKGFNSLIEERVNLYRPYTFDAPIIMTHETVEQLRHLGEILNKALLHMMDNYEKYLGVFPRNTKELRILEICRKYPFTTGSFRADFVIDKGNRINIIEFNSRQPLNGFFDTGYYSQIALRQARKLRVEGVIELYPAFYNYLSNYIGNAKRICVIYEDTPPSDRRFYPLLFENSGIDCHLIKLKELPQKLHLLKDAWVICEFYNIEIMNMPLHLIGMLAACNSHNAIIASLNSGNKRFFCALNDQKFLQNVLDIDEIELIKKFIVPTYSRSRHAEEWDNALRNKDKYILKHQSKGMSEEVYAGSFTSATRWVELLTQPAANEMVLQPFIEQKVFGGSIGEEIRNDYVTGTLLYFNDEFFGPGLYRTHVSPVSSGTGNFRKIAPLISISNNRQSGLYYL